MTIIPVKIVMMGIERKNRYGTSKKEERYWYIILDNEDGVCDGGFCGVSMIESMTNQEKAKERAMQVFPCPNEGEQRRIAELAYNDACNWKDHQFKEYLEKKKSEYGIDYDVNALELLNEIINELFKE